MHDNNGSYRAFFEHALEGLYRSTVDGRLTEVNPALVDMLGYDSSEDLMRIDVARDLYVRGSDREVMLEIVRREGKIEQRNVPIKKKGGSLVIVHDYTRGLFENDRLVGLEGILTDVTKQRRAEIALRESSEKHRSLLQQLPVGVYRTTLSGEILEANHATLKITGCASLNELQQYNAEDFILDVDMRAQHIARLKTYKTSVDEFRFQRIDGEVIWVRDYMNLVEDVDGTTVHIDGVIVDVTVQHEADEARRESEARYRLLVEQFPEPIVVHDGEQIMYANPAAAAFAGAHSAGELKGRNIFDFSHSDSLPDARRRVAAVINEGRRVEPQELKLVMPDGRIIFVEVISGPVRFEGRNASQVLLRDITRQKQHKQALIEARDRAEEMSKLKSAFLANMSHEVRTPLTGILGFAAILKEELEDDKRELAGYIHQSGERLLETLNSVLDLARLEANEVQLNPEEVDIVQEMRESAIVFRPLAAQQNLEIHLEAPEALTIYSDRICLHRIVSNMISNAIKFTDEGDIYVRLAKEGNELVISVRDTGPGIQEDFIPYVFDEFKQGSSGLSRRHQGSGLGLAITKRLVNRLQGVISVESEEGKGSTFIVRVPARLDTDGEMQVVSGG